jgi:GNAT superfamily N-acetyltransferase
MASLSERLLGKTGVEITLSNGSEQAVGSVLVTEKRSNAHIGYLFVRSEERGNGFGSDLLGGAEDWARSRGLKQMTGTLIPVPGSENAVINLFLEHGYQIDEKGNVKKPL